MDRRTLLKMLYKAFDAKKLVFSYGGFVEVLDLVTWALKDSDPLEYLLHSLTCEDNGIIAVCDIKELRTFLTTEDDCDEPQPYQA